MSTETVVYEPHPRYAVQSPMLMTIGGQIARWGTVAQYDDLEEAKTEADRLAKSGENVRVVDQSEDGDD